MDTKARPVYIPSIRDPLHTQGHIQTESEGREKDTPCQWKSKENNYKRQEGYHIMIKGLIQGDITVVNRYAPNIGTPQYIRQMLPAIKKRN